MDGTKHLAKSENDVLLLHIIVSYLQYICI